MTEPRPTNLEHWYRPDPALSATELITAAVRAHKRNGHTQLVHLHRAGLVCDDHEHHLVTTQEDAPPAAEPVAPDADQ